MIFYFFFTLFIIYNLNDPFVIDQNCSTFQKETSWAILIGDWCF